MSEYLASYLSFWPLWRDMLPLPIISLLSGIALILPCYVARKRASTSQDQNSLVILFVVVFAMSLLGIVTGQMTGMSREPAVGAVLPAVLGLVGAIAVYLISSKEIKSQLLVSLLIIGFSSNLMIGSLFGSKLRDDFDKYRLPMEVQLQIELEKQKIEHELALQQLFYDHQIKTLRLKAETQLGQ